MKAAQLKARETAFTSAGKHEPVIFSFPTHDPYMHSAHNERKQETKVKILLENCGTSKKITLSLHSLHGLHSLQSAVCMVWVST